MQNVEFKAELRDPDLARTILGSGALKNVLWIESLEQTDTYFRVPDGRLKKRETVGYPTEYIFYNRTNRSRPKLSNFVLYSEQSALERFGTTPLPIWLVVKKTRDLWLYQGVRIHLDRVESLGSFIEFEALVSPERNLAKCHEFMDELRRAFGPSLGEPIASGYSDLLEAEAASGR
jgi:adenylate cyclase, class 2